MNDNLNAYSHIFTLIIEIPKVGDYCQIFFLAIIISKSKLKNYAFKGLLIYKNVIIIDNFQITNYGKIDFCCNDSIIIVTININEK